MHPNVLRYVARTWVSLSVCRSLSVVQVSFEEVYIAILLIFVHDASQCAQVCCKDMVLYVCV